MKTASNHIKALLIARDFTEEGRVSQDQCLTLQHFDYKCQHCRNENGEPYGSTVSATLNCTMRSTGNIQVFYDRLKSSAIHGYTFVFNAVFDDLRLLTDYEDAMIVRGYVVDVEEDFTTAPDDNGDTRQMLLHVKILLSNITYIGRTSNRTLPIIDVD